MLQSTLVPETKFNPESIKPSRLNKENSTVGRNFCEKMIARPCQIILAIHQWLTMCWRAKESAKAADKDNGRVLLEERREAFPPVPQHAASSFLSTATSRNIREANGIL